MTNDKAQISNKAQNPKDKTELSFAIASPNKSGRGNLITAPLRLLRRYAPRNDIEGVSL